MSAEAFTPTTEQVRVRASRDAARFGFLQELDFEAQFDRWLAEHDRALAEQIAAAIEEGANARAAKRDEHREIAIARRAEGNLIGHDAHMRTALSFRSEATGMWDAAAIAREAVR